MKILKLAWQGVKSALAFLGSLLSIEPVITLIMGTVMIVISSSIVWLVYNAYDYWRSVLIQATGWDKDAISGITVLIVAGPFYTIGIHLSLKEAHKEWRKTHPGPEISIGRRF